MVAGLLRDMDAEGSSPVLVMAGPPCPDFSRVASGSGRSGPTGKLFQVFCEFFEALESELPHHAFFPIVENVIMNRREDVDYFSQQLRSVPFMVCASDSGSSVGLVCSGRGLILLESS